MEDLVELGEAARIMEVSAVAFNQWVKDGYIEKKYIGKRRFFLREDVVNLNEFRNKHGRFWKTIWKLEKSKEMK